MPKLLFVSIILLCSVSWWLGPLVGPITFLLLPGVLVLVRQLLKKKHPDSALVAIPVWQILLAPVLSLPISWVLGLVAFLVGPGF
jgi:hypothetical protein